MDAAVDRVGTCRCAHQIHIGHRRTAHQLRRAPPPSTHPAWHAAARVVLRMTGWSRCVRRVRYCHIPNHLDSSRPCLRSQVLQATVSCFSLSLASFLFFHKSICLEKLPCSVHCGDELVCKGGARCSRKSRAAYAWRERWLAVAVGKSFFFLYLLCDVGTTRRIKKPILGEESEAFFPGLIWF